MSAACDSRADSVSRFFVMMKARGEALEPRHTGNNERLLSATGNDSRCVRRLPKRNDANPIDPRRAPRARPAPLRALAKSAWHRPEEARTAPVAGLGRQPQQPITGGAPKSVSKPRWRTLRLCSTGCNGSWRSCARASIDARRRMRSWRRSSVASYPIRSRRRETPKIINLVEIASIFYNCKADGVAPRRGLPWR